MLCSRFKQILLTKTTFNNNVQFRCFANTRFVSKKCGLDSSFWASLIKHKRDLLKMNSVRFIFRYIGINRLSSAGSRSFNVGHVLRKRRRDRIWEVIHRVSQTLLRPRRTLLFSATAAYKAKGNDEDKSGTPPSCSGGITDEDLKALLLALDEVDNLSKRTLFCLKCSKRMVIDKKYPGIKYCTCKEAQRPVPSPDGWVPYLEAEDTIIWRKEYKRGQGLFAYKVYGRYKDVLAQDYAAVNVDGAYRRMWDSAVAALSVVERNANGVEDQAVLHWEVLWPRLFANRDYVYIRRHKEFAVNSLKSPHLFEDEPAPAPATGTERPSVHSNAKRKSDQIYKKEDTAESNANKVYVIISRSCTHPEVPETRNAIRVSEYWSQMVVRTLDGADKIGMEFVLTYYDEPAVGGMPSGVTAWATGRAAPDYLQRMRVAAKDYAAYRRSHNQDIPDFTPFRPETQKVSYEDETRNITRMKEEDMESAKTGPDMECRHTREQGTQTDETNPPVEIDLLNASFYVKETKEEYPTQPGGEKEEGETLLKEEENNNSGWWNYLYPFYFFV